MALSVVKPDPNVSYPHAPDEFCRCCNLKAPKKLAVGDYGRSFAWTPDLTGWMVSHFPFTDYRHQTELIHDYTKEMNRFCPKCTAVIMGTVVHLTNPL